MILYLDKPNDKDVIYVGKFTQSGRLTKVANLTRDEAIGMAARLLELALRIPK